MKSKSKIKHSKRSLTRRAQRARVSEPGIKNSYPSMGALSGALFIPLALLKTAKRDGCPGFEESNRVRVLPVLEWIFSRDDSSTNWQEYGRKFNALMAEVDYNRKVGSVADRDAIQSTTRDIMATLFSELDRIFTMELPPASKGLDEVGVRSKNEAAIKKLKATLGKIFEAMMKTETKEDK